MRSHARSFRSSQTSSPRLQDLAEALQGISPELEGTAWKPRTRLQAIGLWPLFGWETDRAENREVFELGDLILISVFKMRRVGSVTYWSILGLLRWETGTATLQSVEEGV